MNPQNTEQLQVSEIFYSLQGETSLMGIPFTFIRLTGCNLRCLYCDSTYAHTEGTPMSIQAIVEKAQRFPAQHVLVTGGEPLLQAATPKLVKALQQAGFQVSIETNGEVSIATVASSARIIMDIKTPGSGVKESHFAENLPYLKSSDEIKFVITSPEDYAWAKNLLQTQKLPTQEIIFSPVVPNLDPTWLAEQILKDQLQVRFQLQLHKILWGRDRRGV